MASKEPAPASGSASAAVVAAAAALLEKVSRLSTRHWPEAAGALERAHALRLRAEELVEEDLHAYVAYVAAVRSAAGVDEAAGATIEVPLEIVRSGAAVVELAGRLAEQGNPRLKADAIAAAILAAAGAETAAMLIAVNVGGATDGRLEEARGLAAQAADAARALRPPGS